MAYGQGRQAGADKRRTTTVAVIHHEEWLGSRSRAEAALACGADGVVVVSEMGDDLDALGLAAHLSKIRPGRIGVAMPMRGPGDAFALARRQGVATLWCEDAGITAAGAGPAARAMAILGQADADRGRRPMVVYAGIACGGGATGDPGEAARHCLSMGLVPTAHAGGDAPPAPAEIAAIRAAIGPDAPLAVAGAIAASDAAAYLEHANIFLATPAMSNGYRRFDRARLKAFIEAVREGAGAD